VVGWSSGAVAGFTFLGIAVTILGCVATIIGTSLKRLQTFMRKRRAGEHEVIARRLREASSRAPPRPASPPNRDAPPESMELEIMSRPDTQTSTINTKSFVDMINESQRIGRMAAADELSDAMDGMSLSAVGPVSL